MFLCIHFRQEKRKKLYFLRPKTIIVLLFIPWNVCHKHQENNFLVFVIQPSNHLFCEIVVVIVSNNQQEDVANSGSWLSDVAASSFGRELVNFLIGPASTDCKILTEMFIYQSTQRYHL